jgi:quinol monooxygenase YgiN
MAKVILHIAYEIKPEHRDAYLVLAAEMKHHFAVDRNKNYVIYEQKGRKNSFVEEFTCGSMEQLEALDDDMTETSENLVNRLEAMLMGKAKYTTMVEL